MGRKRTTGCTRRHLPNDPCAPCAAARAARSRLRRRDRARRGEHPEALLPPVDTERAALDADAAAHRAQAARARAYVDRYRRRGALRPPDLCERCAAPPRRGTGLVAWHPDPAQAREIAWLCGPCRTYLRATREPLTLTWIWPGLPPRPRGRPAAGGKIRIEAAWIAAAQAATARASLPGLQEALLLQTFLTHAGPATAAALRAQGAAVAARAGNSWRPTGDQRLDAVLGMWACEAAEGEERVVVPTSPQERRARRDRLPPLPQSPARARRENVDPSVLAQRMGRALDHLADAEAEADAALERVAAAMERLGLSQRGRSS